MSEASASPRRRLRTVEAFPHQVRTIDPVWIPLGDGTRLAARLWLPEDAEARPVPAILEYLPYRRRDGTAFRDARTHPYFAGHGYAAIRVDMRGSGDSDGLLLDEYVEAEQDDGLEIIDWISRQPWCSGEVGMIGISWGGFNGLQIAARRPPALKAVISLCSTDDRYGCDVHYMGGALLSENLRWAATMLGYQSRPPDPAVVGERWRQMWIDRLEAEPLMLRTWLEHQTRDDYWKHGSIGEAPEAITAAVYLIGGWADAYTSAVPRMLEKLRCPRKGLIGPWAHRYPHVAAPGPTIGFLQEALRWWDHWLKGLPTGIMDEPRLRIWLQDYVTPATEYSERPGRWIAEPSWPSPRIALQAWHLGDRALAPAPVAGAPLGIASPEDTGRKSGNWCAFGSVGEQPGDQRSDDGLSVCFDSAPLAEGFDIVGAPVFSATLVSDQPQATLIVRLCDVAPDGASLRLSYGVLNLTQRDSDEQPTPLPVGAPLTIRLRLNDCAHAFAPGQRIRLALSTNYWPIVWPVPATARLTLLPGARLALPVRPRAAADGDLRPFAEPEAAPSLARTTLRPPEFARRAIEDQLSGETHLEEREDSGRFRIEETGLEYELAAVSRLSIRPGDPLSAAGEVSYDMAQGRGGWQVRASTRTTLRANAVEFIVEASLEAFEGEQRLLARDWHVRIPRRLI